jgi:hypothetical protein
MNHLRNKLRFVYVMLQFNSATRPHVPYYATHNEVSQARKGRVPGTRGLACVPYYATHHELSHARRGRVQGTLGLACPRGPSGPGSSEIFFTQSHAS